ncbi:hypothetical protein DFH27DRAFT_610413 [Peziza echinospora]|nr:hypothetical protein DFH27DRAFT_610413 [Peziza echinospora]
MASAAPFVNSREWALKELSLEGLVLSEPKPLFKESLGPNDVLVKIISVSLNYRDILIINQGGAGFVKRPEVPISDASALVLAVGPEVKEFKKGDRVINSFFQNWISGEPTREILQSSVGAEAEGVLKEYAVFPESGLVRAPENLSWNEASTLSCAALTAWSALSGLGAVKKGDYVLTQGTGGVSLFALQFAIAAGAHVIATTSSDEKSKFLLDLGADHVINYKTTPEWGAAARALTPGGLGFNIIVDVGGPGTLPEAVKAIRIRGVVSLVGFLGGFNYTTTAGDILFSGSVFKPVMVGSRAELQEMVAAIEKHNIKPVIHKQVFEFENAQEAIRLLISQKQIGKIVVQVGSEV